MSQEISQIPQGSSQQFAIAKNNNSTPYQQQTPIPDGNPLSQAQLTADTVLINAAKGVRSERLQRIDGSVADNTALATQVRQTDSAIDAVSSHVQAMRENLAKILKNFPPFSIDNKDRLDYLRSFSGLRKEIETMTIPELPKQLGVQLKSELWQQKGLAGLLPGDLSSNAPDAQIQVAHDQLDIAVRAISNGKQELKQNILAKG